MLIKQLAIIINENHSLKSGCLVHRDIKPENIIISKQKNLNLVDYGYAIVLESNI